MDLLSLPYALFVLITVFSFHVCPPQRRAILLFAVSVSFYAYYSPISAALLIVLAVTVFYSAAVLNRLETRGYRRRALLLLVMGILLAYLLLIKLLPFAHHHEWAASIGSVLLALGVSYYTFKLLGYLLDVFWGRYLPQTHLIEFLAFVTFYPQLPAGPIQRANEFSISCDSDTAAELMVSGLRRILLGAVKKTVVADQLGSIISSINDLQPQRANMLWIAACLYTLEIYFDFSALTDIAIGTASLFGIRSPENFALPFLAPNISQFWRRWHMTLTLWLTDYVFTPLHWSLRDYGNWGLVCSLTVTMTLISLWHGLSVGFLLFGLIQSAFLVIDALTASTRRRLYRRSEIADKLTAIIGPCFVFASFTFSLVFFRSQSMSEVNYQMQHLWIGLRTPVSSLTEVYYDFGREQVALVGLATLCLLLLEYVQSAKWKRVKLHPKANVALRPLRWVLYNACLAIVMTLHFQSTHFIYAQF